MSRRTQVVVIGGGQAGLATAYFLRRADIDHVVLDNQPEPGGAWRHTWPSLRLFSPAEFSSLPGWQMPPHRPGNPTAEHVIDYLQRYEARYRIPVERPVQVRRVTRATPSQGPVEGLVAEGFVVETDAGTWLADAVVSATGTWSRPFVPFYPGLDIFAGTQTHSAVYRGPDAYEGRRVLVVGGANSGAQIAAELTWVSELTWCTLGPPRYLPNEVDGRDLFQLATARVRGAGPTIGSLGDIVALPPVRRAREAGRLEAVRMFERFTPDGIVFPDGSHRRIDDVVWCTGFRPALHHLTHLDLPRRGKRFITDGPLVPGVPGLCLMGYGDWTGPASATLIGVGQWARRAVRDLAAAHQG